MSRSDNRVEIFGIVDCNNFYVSCERVFRPDLEGKPVVVLSNNDGCIISRSSEAKAAGIKMGAPYWGVKSLLKKHQVTVFSSNYPLYGDLSARIMNVLSQHCDDLDEYSIDEAFVSFFVAPEEFSSLQDRSKCIREIIFQQIGIPVSIGLAKTKTLAKAANYLSKRVYRKDVLSLIDDAVLDRELSRVPISEVWGVGRAIARQLSARGVSTAADVHKLPLSWVKQKYGVTGLRTVRELRNISCIELDKQQTRKSVMVSRSFRKDIFDLTELCEAIAVYATRVGEKLRRANVQARYISVFVRSNPHKPKSGQAREKASRAISLPLPISNTADLIQVCTKLMKQLYKPKINYKKAGIIAHDLSPINQVQGNLFCEQPQSERFDKLQQAIDSINASVGSHVLQYASCGKDHTWSRKAQWESPHYTTKWDSILHIGSQIKQTHTKPKNAPTQAATARGL